MYGVRKLHKAARRAGLDIGRDQTRRLMRLAGITGVTRAKTVKTTRRKDGAVRHPDLVRRDFTASGPNQLWVTDLTYVPTWAGVAYVCFITDVYSRMIVGWRVASHMRTDLSCWSAEEIDAVAHALNTRPRKSLDWKTPAEAFNEHLLLLQQAGVASTG